MNVLTIYAHPNPKSFCHGFTLQYPGIKQVEHEYFYALYGANDETRRGYLDRAYRLGKDFGVARNVVTAERGSHAAE